MLIKITVSMMGVQRLAPREEKLRVAVQIFLWTANITWQKILIYDPPLQMVLQFCDPPNKRFKIL